MSEELLVVTPQDWIEVPSVAGVIVENGLEPEINDYIINNGPFDLLTRFMEEAGILPAGSSVLNARTLKDSNGLRVWVKVG